MKRENIIRLCRRLKKVFYAFHSVNKGWCWQAFKHPKSDYYKNTLDGMLLALFDLGVIKTDCYKFGIITTTCNTKKAWKKLLKQIKFNKDLLNGEPKNED